MEDGMRPKPDELCQELQDALNGKGSDLERMAYEALDPDLQDWCKGRPYHSICTRMLLNIQQTRLMRRLADEAVSPSMKATLEPLQKASAQAQGRHQDQAQQCANQAPGRQSTEQYSHWSNQQTRIVRGVRVHPPMGPGETMVIRLGEPSVPSRPEPWTRRLLNFLFPQGRAPKY